MPLLRSRFNVRDKLGECLRETGVISDAELGKALAEQRRTGERLGVILVRLGLVTEAQLAETVAAQLGFPYVSLTEDPDKWRRHADGIQAHWPRLEAMAARASALVG